MITVRSEISLDGAWQFQIDPQGTQTREQIQTWRTIQVPAPWQAQFDDLHMVSGVGWYQRTVTIPADWAEQAIFLCFGAVEYLAQVWVNGQSAGQHEGGYLPFDFEVSSLLKPGQENEITVRVTDPSKENDGFPDYPFREIPNGKQSWYGPIGGIWQSVTLEARAPQHIRQIRITPQGLTGQVDVQIQIIGSADTVRIRCYAGNGEQVALLDAPAREITEINLNISDPVLWDIDTPHRYRLEIDLLKSDQGVDHRTEYFGIRTFEARDKKLWLNGKLFYMRGALDQDYYPEGIYTPPSMDFLRAQVRQAKAMGLNCLRCHIKIADPRYLQAADEEGILIWAEVPSWGTLTEDAARRVQETFEGMVQRDWNHPSIGIWTLVNENWGTDLVNQPHHREWLTDLYYWAHRVDPHRVIVDNSPCPDNFHVRTDIEDYHFYANQPEGVDRWQKFVTDFANRADFTFATSDQRKGDEPLLVSEFGNWGLPDLKLLREAYNGDLPWWFETGKGWYPDVVYPAGVEERFHALGMNQLFKDWSALAEAAQWSQYRALKYEIEVMRAESAISGYVITEWSDLHWECNGLVDMARNPRIFAERFAALQADTLIVPRWERLAYWSDETVIIELLLSHMGREALQDAKLHWSIEDTEFKGEVGTFSAEPGQVISAGKVMFTPLKMNVPTPSKITFTLEAADGTIINHNDVSIMTIPASYRDTTPEDRVVSILTDELLAEIRDGAQIVLCTTTPGEIHGLPNVKIEARADTPRSGDWVSSFDWIRPEVTRIPVNGFLDFSWHGFLPQHVITGLSLEQTLAGLFIGWLHLPAGLIGRIPMGKGSLIVTTFPLLDAAQSPMATVLRADLMQSVAERVE